MIFNLSQKSLEKLQGVDERLVAIVHDAIKISRVDFAVGEGLRTVERQRELIAKKLSKIKNSKHLFGEAVDLFAYVDGGIKWDLPYYFDIAEAMKEASIKHDTVLRWGAVWDRDLNKIKDTSKEPSAYTERRKAIGKKAFIDAVHFEIK
jgi:peptidoglycan L-alanyl-D-glutamate endopeptidase CwlK